MTENAELNPALSPLTSENKVESEAKTPEMVTLHQHQLNDLLKEQRERGYRKAQQELVTQQGLQQPQQQSPQPPQQMQGSMGGMPAAANPDDVRRMVSEQLAEQHRMAQGQHIVNSFMGKMEHGKTKYPDFNEKISKLGDLKNIPAIIQLAEHVDNTHDVMYDIASNPHKLASLNELARINPALAFEEIRNLSSSIKANDDASNQARPSEPLSQLKSSVTNGSGKAGGSVAYYKNKYRA
jgi:hypothetical protein